MPVRACVTSPLPRLSFSSLRLWRAAVEHRVSRSSVFAFPSPCCCRTCLLPSVCVPLGVGCVCACIGVAFLAKLPMELGIARVYTCADFNVTPITQEAAEAHILSTSCRALRLLPVTPCVCPPRQQQLSCRAVAALFLVVLFVPRCCGPSCCRTTPYGSLSLSVSPVFLYLCLCRAFADL